MFVSKTHNPEPMDAMPQDGDALARIKDSLRKAAVERNLKTALILGVGASGALISLPWFAATAAGTTVALSIARYRQQR